MLILTDKTFDTHINDVSGPAIVMFSAPWAGPCNLVRPAYERAAARFGNQINFFEFVIDDNPAIPQRFNLRGVPAFYVFEDDDILWLHTGAMDENTLIEIVKSVLPED